MQEIEWDKAKHFRLNYLACKLFGKTDQEIINSLGVSKKTFYKMKEKCGLISYRRVYKNQQGLTQEQLRTAEKNGIGRENALKRVRVFGWSKKDAVTVPVRKYRRRKWEE